MQLAAAMRSGPLSFLTVNLCVLGLGYFCLIEPAMSLLADQADRIDDRRQELSRYARLADQAHAAEQLGDKLQQNAGTSAFLPSADEGAASAFLQGRLREMATQAGLQIRSLASADGHKTEGIRHMTVRLDAAGTVGAIDRGVSAIEGSGAPVLFIDNFAIHAAASTEQDSFQEPLLNVQVDVSGVVP